MGKNIVIFSGFSADQFKFNIHDDNEVGSAHAQNIMMSAAGVLFFFFLNDEYENKEGEATWQSIILNYYTESIIGFRFYPGRAHGRLCC